MLLVNCFMILFSSGHVSRVLLFNATGDRSAENLLQILSGVHFDRVAFCTNIASKIAVADNGK